MPKFGIPMWKSKNILPVSNPRWRYNFHIEVRGQGHTEFMNVHDTSYHGDTLTCQIKYDYVKGQKSWRLNTKLCHKHYKFDLKVKGQLVSGSWLLLTHPVMVIDPCAKVGHEHITKAYRFEHEIKGQHRIGEHECTCLIFSWW